MGWQDAPVVDTAAGGWQSAPLADAPAPDEQPLNWSDVPGQAARNFIPSLGGVLHDIAQPIIHPIDTATNLKNLGAGVLQKTGVMAGDDSVQYADAFAQYFGDRYGSTEGFKQALAKDPAGVLADLSAVFSGGGAAAARAPGLVGKTASIVGKVGHVIDPLNAVKLPAAGAMKVADLTLGATTGVGAKPIAAAREAGREGGAASEALTSQMRGSAPIDEIVSDARAAADQMKQAAQGSYVRDMAVIGKSPTTLHFNDVDKALANVDKIVKFEGRDRPALTGVRDQLNELVTEWKGSDPAKFHTPAGFDELKKNVWDIMEPIPFDQGAKRKIVGDVYDAVKNTIVKQDPRYADTMANYERYSKQLREIERSLIGKPGAPVDTALRKLTSIMRNNVNTNFSKREALAQQLEAAGAPQLTNKIAGASLNSWEPRGLSKLAGAGALIDAITGLATGGGVGSLAMIPAALAAGSPRLVGEGSHAVGVAQRFMDSYGRPTLEGLRQSGRPRVYINTSEFQ
jgi:hypothetical protein